jgi:hypothetical protein
LLQMVLKPLVSPWAISVACLNILLLVHITNRVYAEFDCILMDLHMPVGARSLYVRIISFS